MALHPYEGLEAPVSNPRYPDQQSIGAMRDERLKTVRHSPTTASPMSEAVIA